MTVSGTGVIRSIVMAPSKQHLVIAPQTGDAQLWHIMSNSIVHTFKGKHSRIEYFNMCSECVSLPLIWCSINGNRTDLKEFSFSLKPNIFLIKLIIPIFIGMYYFPIFTISNASRIIFFMQYIADIFSLNISPYVVYWTCFNIFFKNSI